MLVGKKQLVVFSMPLILGLATYFVLMAYMAGDRIVYAELYQTCTGMSFFDGYACYVSAIATFEPFYYLVMSAGYELNLSHNVLMSLANIFLLWAFLRFSVKNNVNIYFAVFTAITNYYFWTLVTELERLKFCIALFFWYQSCSKPFIKLKFGPVLALLAHLQIAAIALPMLLFGPKPQRTVRERLSGYIRKDNQIFGLIFMFAFIFFVIYIQREIVLSKFLHYFILDKTDISTIVLATAYFIFAVTLLPKTNRNIAVFTSIFICSLLIGGARVNLMYFVAYYVISAPMPLSKNYGLLLLTFYYFIKTVYFLENLITTGRGYDVG